jgi:hypothetical protein
LSGDGSVPPIGERTQANITNTRPNTEAQARMGVLTHFYTYTWMHARLRNRGTRGGSELEAGRECSECRSKGLTDG